MIPEELVKDLQVLKESGHNYEITEDGGKIYIVFKDYLLPSSMYNVDKTELLIFTTAHYPNAGFDMFWVSPNLLLKNNTVPKNADVMENHIGRSWRRFSYHPYNNKPWNAADDSVIVFMSYVQQRLQKGD